MAFSAIVLAAGKSERMGSPKALLRWGERTFLQSILDAVALSKLEDPVVVVGHHKDEILEAGVPVRWVFNPDYESGMTTSFQTGIRSLADGFDGAMLFLVDHPGPSADTIHSLIGAFMPGGIVVPRSGGRRGHPVLFSTPVLNEILYLRPDVGANTVVQADPQRVIEVNVPDAGVLRDIDDPDDYGVWVPQ